MDSFRIKAINMLVYIHVNSPSQSSEGSTLTVVDIPVKGKKIKNKNIDINMQFKKHSPNHCSKNAKSRK